jgi:hypothetical protein
MAKNSGANLNSVSVAMPTNYKGNSYKTGNSQINGAKSLHKPTVDKVTR